MELLFDVIQYRECLENSVYVRVKLLAENIPLDKALEVYKNHYHIDDVLKGTVYTTISVELSVKSKQDLVNEQSIRTLEKW